MSRKRRRTLPATAAVAAPTPEPDAAVIETQTEHEPNAVLVQAVQRAIAPTSDEAIAIRRLRDRLIDKIFTPDRSLNSWTELKATN